MTSLTPTQQLVNAIERDRGGLAVVWWPTVEIRDWLVDEIRSVVPDAADLIVVHTVGEVLAAPDRLVVLIPREETDVIDDLDGSRDMLLERTQPLVVLLLRDGDGAARLRQRPSLASWIRGSDVDPDQLSTIDVPAERAHFTTEVGESPEAWLRRWERGEFERTGANFTRAYWAAMLGESRSQ